MPLLRFDPSGSIDPDFGVTHEQIGSLSNTLDSLAPDGRSRPRAV